MIPQFLHALSLFFSRLKKKIMASTQATKEEEDRRARGDISASTYQPDFSVRREAQSSTNSGQTAAAAPGQANSSSSSSGSGPPGSSSKPGSMSSMKPHHGSTGGHHHTSGHGGHPGQHRRPGRKMISFSYCHWFPEVFLLLCCFLVKQEVSKTRQPLQAYFSLL